MKLAPASLKSTIFVVLQFSCLILIFYNIRIIPDDISSSIGIAIFLIPGFWAVYCMKFRFNIAPDISSDKELTMNGPYKFIRHPMYTSLLGITLIYIINDISFFKIAVYIVLLINLLLKLGYEEEILLAKFREYADYRKRTKKLIPFIY